MRLTLRREDGMWHYAACYRNKTAQGYAVTREAAKAARLVAMYTLMGS